ncbi:M13 family metallopeptidase [Massilia psychrophila]|uniref:Peptidase M13 n=1 Tax=Massilia psychrophila TaxID=1603353 RepID=A0A2G8T1E8_9BURK|nr:M13-type metalloendopeptidase [Massilia psychrophila]PIL39834.1 peptidase M13 [Massilia psychrophila]GGE80175.1 peptidase M13 [Massilia psychrophila]
MNRYLLSALTMSLLTAFTHAHAGEGAAAAKTALTAKPAALGSGIAVDYFDPSVRVQDDFFTHLNGKWLKTTAIPADKASWGSFAKLQDDTQPQLRAIIENAAKSPNQAAGTDAQRIGDFYASFMNEKKANALGLAPLNAELARIAAIKSRAELPAMMAHLGRLGVGLPYDFGIHQDAKDSTKYVADIMQGGLGLPDRDYYLKKDDAKLADALAKYGVYVEKMLALAGSKTAAADAKAILALETELAKVQWTKVQNRDPVKTYNKVELAKMAEVAPGYDWQSYLDSAGISSKAGYVIVSQPSYLKGFADVVNKTPLESWKAYLQIHLINAYAPLLSKPFVDTRFAFYGTTLSGVTEMQPRWKRAVGAVETSQGESLGKLYVAQHFPAERKVRMEAMVKNLLAAYKQSIDTLDWMSPETKKEAQSKLAKFRPKIGYPNRWKDYSALVVSRDDLVGNVMRSRTLESNRELNKLGKPIDREEWGMTPQTINAYYNPEMNEIVFPAAILQPPFFDAKADDAVNYGAIGAVIGHEISHGFDDQGAQYDGDGNLRDWWSAADHKNFAAKTQMLVKQYSAYSPLPGYNVNGELTLGENIADNSGVAIAYKAYKLSLNGKKAPVISGLTGDQRFFMGFGQVWRMKMREPQQIVQVKTDPHSPGQFRANGTMMNQPAFYEAFNVKPGDKMYLAPKDRVIIW